MAYRKRLYWYRSRRQGQRVVTDYLGSGVRGLALAIVEAEQREQQQVQRRALRLTKARWRAVMSRVDALRTITRALMRLELRAAGYRPHKGQWRQARRGI